jgi:hypothetical protein
MKSNENSQEQGVDVLFAAYSDASTEQTQGEHLGGIIDHVVRNPEGDGADVLSKVAQTGDKRCANAIGPLLEVFWNGDFEWQEAIISLLGEIAHLAPLHQRVRIGQFLGHLVVSEEFIGGSGVDTVAIKALAQIAENSGAAFKDRLSKGDLRVREEGEAHRAFDAEVGC